MSHMIVTSLTLLLLLMHPGGHAVEGQDRKARIGSPRDNTNVNDAGTSDHVESLLIRKVANTRLNTDGRNLVTDFSTLRDDISNLILDDGSVPAMEIDDIQEEITLPPLRNPGRSSDLGHCEGDCDEDDDCQDGLVCWQRESSDEEIPGCSGMGESRDDYCIYTKDLPPGPDMDVFRLRMYGWNHYSGSSGHRGSWCVECDGSCHDGQNLDVGSCDSGSEEWRFINLSYEKTMIQLDGTDLCWELSSGDLELKDCDPTDECQFFSPGRGSYWASRFEFVTCRGRCVTQDHYPRSGEDFFGESCSTARRHKSSFFEKY